MTERIFCCNFKGQWNELTETAPTLDEGISSPVFYVAYHNEGTGENWEKVWCKKHQAYEEVNRQDGLCLVTNQGCQLTGLCARVNIYIQLSGWNALQRHHEEANLCWRVQHGKEPGTMRCICEKVQLSFTWQKNENNNTAYLCPHPSARFHREWTISKDSLTSHDRIPAEVLRVARQELQLSPDGNEARTPSSQPTDWDMEEFLTLNEQSFHRKDFAYREEEFAYECNICGYNFRLISSIEQFCHIVRSMEGIRIFEKEVQPKATALVAVERNGKYLAGIVLDGKQRIHMYRRYEQNILSEVKLHAVCAYWEKKAGVESECSRSEYRELEVQMQEQELTDKAAVEISLRQLLQTPSENIWEGYFLLLHLRMAEAGLPLVSIPADEVDEQAYLMEKIPVGERIFTAAFQENAEAEYVMHLLYSDFSCFSHPCRRLAKRWFLRAISHGWREIAPEKRDIVFAMS